VDRTSLCKVQKSRDRIEGWDLEVGLNADAKLAGLLTGKCHCGNIGFSLAWGPAPTVIPARACTCSFCAKHGGVWTSNPDGALRIAVKDPAQTSKYAFGTKQASFHICTRCGVVPVVTSQVDGTLYAVVSVNALEGVDESLIQRQPTNFDGEAVGDRLARWRRNWIRDVEFLEPGLT
jgi:hypothetical protein